MAHIQDFRGLLAFADRAAVDHALAESVAGFDEEGAFIQGLIAKAIEHERIIRLDYSMSQPASQWEVWTGVLSELAARASAGGVQCTFHGDGSEELFCEAAGQAEATDAIDSSSRNFVPRAPAKWTFDATFGDTRLDDSWEVVAEQGEWFSIRTPGPQALRGVPQNEALFTRELRASGSVIVAKARGGERVWLDTAAAPGAAWLMADDFCDDLMLQSYVGTAQVECPSGEYETQHYQLERFDPFAAVGQRYVTDLYMAAGHGVVKVVSPEGEFLRSSQSRGSEAAPAEEVADAEVPQLPWWKFWG